MKSRAVRRRGCILDRVIPHPRRPIPALFALAALCGGLAGWRPAGPAVPAARAIPPARTAASAAPPRRERAVRFNRDVRPILSERCWVCHGPDGGRRKAGLRLDTREGATATLASGKRAVVPGEPAGSELLHRVRAANEDERMPPAEHGERLAPDEVRLLERWIAEGARWEAHWSFIPPERPAPPAVRDERWPRDPLDRFVLARLEAEGLAPAPEASRAAWLRRVTYALTGLPPTIDELDAFEADGLAGAYERVVDRLLGSLRYAEHMARFWLDAARYGDTHGLHLDNERSMWKWRDWVVSAFERNLPYDQFVTWQLAGDLLPERTLEQRIASGFNRVNPTSAEGGMIAEEYLAIYAKDRTDTFGTVFLGLTVRCAQCHDHKFDPLTQRDYYRLFGFFHSLAEDASDQNALAPPPAIRAPDPALAARIAAAERAAAAARARLDEPMPQVDASQREWERETAARLAARWRPLAVRAASSRGGATLEVLEDGSVLAGGSNPKTDVYELVAVTDAHPITALRVEALRDERLPQTGPGRAENGNFVLTGVEVEAADLRRASPGAAVPLAREVADFEQPRFPASAVLDGDAGTGWAVLGGDGGPRALVLVPPEPFGGEEGTRLVVRLRFESPYPLHAIGRVRLSVSSDPTLAPARFSVWRAAGPFTAASFAEAWETAWIDPRESEASDAGWVAREEFADGALHALEGERAATYLMRTVEVPAERRLVLGLGSDDALRVWLDGELVLENDVRRPLAPDQERLALWLEPGRHTLLLEVVNDLGGYGFTSRVIADEVPGLPLALARVLVTPPSERGDEQRAALRAFFRRNRSPRWRALERAALAREEEHERLVASAPLTLVSEELDEPRPTHVLERGLYDHPGERVEPGVPAFLGEPPAGAPANRLGLARWLVAPDHPLTARVEVNRLWQQLFGRGLVGTPDDFGAQGEWPSHPELLDYLAVEFVESGWDVQALLRRLVLSATFRQDSRVRPALAERDPHNRLLARGPRLRLDAEEIRDTALFVSGLLVEKRGGKGVKPYQPEGVWEAVAYTSSNTAKYVRDSGEALYRRSLYTFWKRTAPPPNMLIFDAPMRETCTVYRPRTNTPLQALVLMNDVQFVEAARAFATRLLRGEAERVDARLARAFRAATSRRPDAGELDVLREALAGLRRRFEADPAAAEALVAVGESAVPLDLPAPQLAAWTAVASLVLNLDEAIHRP